jgi:Tol biopolymer transport system component
MRNKPCSKFLGIILCFYLGIVFISIQSCKKDEAVAGRVDSLGISSEDSSPSWSPDGARIVFHSGKDEQSSDIYIMNADGSHLTRLTDEPASDGSPSWSPNGQKIAFSSNREGNSEIYVMNMDGSNQIRLTDNPANDGGPSWFPDGSRIIFVSNRDGNWEIYNMDADGSNQSRLTNNSAGDGSPSLSPDGTRIVFRSSRDDERGEIYIMNVNGSNPTRLTENSAGDASPSWSPDSSRIIFVSNRDGNWEIYAMNADGSDQNRLTNNPAGDVYPSWSPDGQKILFVSDREFNREVYVMDADGSDPVNLTNNAPVDSTSGTGPIPKSELNLEEIPYKIVFESLRKTEDQENWEICLIDADGSNITNLTKTPDIDERYPHASPDGRLVCFTAVEGDGQESESRNVYFMNIDGTAKVKIAENADQPCWSPNGRYIAYLPCEYPRYDPSRRANKGLEFYDLETGEKKRHPSDKIVHISDPVWSQDGKWIVADQGILKAFSVDDDSIFRLYTIGCTPDISPDGKRISWNNSDFHMNMGVLDLDSPDSNVTDHTVFVACEPPYWVYESDWSPDGNYWAFIYGVFDDDTAVEMGLESVINICVCDLRTGKWTQITHDGIINREPDWVPMMEGK